MEAAKKKKVHPLVAGPLRPYPPPSSLMAIEFFFFSLKLAEKRILITFFSPQFLD